MTTPAQKRANVKRRDARKARGVRFVTLGLSPPAWDRLDALAKVHGSKDKAVEKLLLDDERAARTWDGFTEADVADMRASLPTIARAGPRLSAPVTVSGERIERKAKQKSEGKKR